MYETFTPDKGVLQLLQVGVNLGRPGYMEEIKKQTEGLDIQIVFCNAGYVLTGFFDRV